MVTSDFAKQLLVVDVKKTNTNVKPLHYRACNLERNTKCSERAI